MFVHCGRFFEFHIDPCTAGANDSFDFESLSVRAFEWSYITEGF